jgi:PIN domain nuclease of toxin-antitoxin system
VAALGRLPEIHRDPFDRILIAQALVENLPLVSKDVRLSEYKVHILW